MKADNFSNKRKFGFTLAEGATHVDNFADVRKFGFTLAEVLITLGIIGVVAAITLSVLNARVNTKKLETAFKVAYSNLSQATKMVAYDYDGGLRERFATYDYENKVYPNHTEIENTFYKKMRVIGTCRYILPVKNFHGSTDVYLDLGRKNPNKALSNGMCLEVNVNGGNINVSVDINGTSLPNRLGYDIFVFYIDANDNLQPKTASKLYTDEEIENMDVHDATKAQTGNPCYRSSKQSGNGLGCAGWALRNINPDNPDEPYWDSLK